MERVVQDAERRGRVIGVRPAAVDEEDAEPWGLSPSRRFQEPPLQGPFPACLKLTLADQIYIERDGLPPGLRNRLVRVAAFQNPEFYRAQAMRLPTYDKPRVIACAEETPVTSVSLAVASRRSATSSRAWVSASTCTTVAARDAR